MKKWQYFLGCLALSAAIWLIHNLSHMQTDVITVSVLAESNIPGRSALSSEAVSMTARCKASGFRLIYLERKQDAITVRFDPDDLTHEDGDFFSISSSQLYRYVNDIFGPGSSVESFLFDKLSFRFLRELNRKVPVNVVSSMTFRPQYMQNGSIRVKPDSVLVYGPADLIGNIESISTRSIVRSDIKGSLHGEIALEAPDGVRLSDDAVAWAMDVNRYVELAAELPVSGRNVPAGSGFSIYPNMVKVVFRCVFPVISDPTNLASCYVDYKEFAGSLTGRCIIHCDNVPAGVISYTVQPEVAECVEKL
ncbi:MAG: YbbR-like domain-containing protein [Bacteroidales bacterium]|nr:YbbR-like domain-containing protein [Bacteroidales bacterium]